MLWSWCKAFWKAVSTVTASGGIVGLVGKLAKAFPDEADAVYAFALRNHDIDAIGFLILVFAHWLMQERKTEKEKQEKRQQAQEIAGHVLKSLGLPGPAAGTKRARKKARSTQTGRLKK